GEFGHLANTKGDCEVDSKGGKRTLVLVSVALRPDAEHVRLGWTMRIVEGGGDRTTLEADKASSAFDAKDGWQIVGIRTVQGGPTFGGGKDLSFTGEKHGKQMLAAPNGTLTNLEYVADAPGKNDCHEAGLAGTVSFDVDLEEK